jgi:hypothetical protein
VVVAGDAFRAGMLLWRYDLDGAADPTFGGDGVVMPGIGNGRDVERWARRQSKRGRSFR